MENLSALDNVLRTVEGCTKKVENFLSVQNDVATRLQQSAKDLYDFTKNEAQRKSAALPELVIEDFDEEQIWQQLEIQNDSELTHLLTDVSRVLAGSNKLELPISLSKPEEHLDEGENVESREKEAEEMSDADVSDSDEMDLDIDVKGNFNRRDNPRKRPKKPSVVDDKFFKLEELDEYLTKEEKKESKIKPDESEDSEDESVDLFNDDSGVDEEDDDEAKMIKYADFFDSPDYENEENEPRADNNNETILQSEEEDEIEDEQSENLRKRKIDEDKSSEKRVKFNLTNDSDDSESIENENMKESEEQKSTLESRQVRLQKRIQQLEKEAISDKPWQLKGEITGSSRPQNSLLEEFVEFDVTTRPAPVITEQTTITLEELIKRRIKDKAWDDVEKKFKPVETPLEYKKKLVMDQEKSKKSLAEIYEDAYLKQKEAANPDVEEKEEEEPKAHQEIRELMNSLFKKLDALSNFHYTPKMVQPEIKIISNIPAINMEEVAPVATTDAALLAPEEIKDKARGDVIGKSERTKTDMKRARRKKKLKQHQKQKASEKKERTLGDIVEMKRKKLDRIKKGKNPQDPMIKKLIKDRNISKIDETTQKVPKSSTAFFTQLQDQVTSHIKSKMGKSTKKKDKVSHSAVKLKL